MTAQVPRYSTIFGDRIWSEMD